MSARTILITGARGIIGTVLRAALEQTYDVHGVDLPDDIRRPSSLEGRMDGVETVIHLARERYVPEDPPRPRERIYPSNVQMDVNVFGEVIRAGVRRLIVASSVHADDFRAPDAEPPLTPPGSYCPSTPYGAYKLVSEEVGKVLSGRFGFEFVALRLGGVSADDSVKEGAGRSATFLSQADLAAAVRACLAAEPVAGRSTVFYVVSDNADRIHDTGNPFGWTPKRTSGARTR